MKKTILLLALLPLMSLNAQHLSDYTLSIETSSSYQSIAATGTAINFGSCAPGSQAFQYDQTITMPFDFELGPVTIP